MRPGKLAQVCTIREVVAACFLAFAPASLLLPSPTWAAEPTQEPSIALPSVHSIQRGVASTPPSRTTLQTTLRSESLRKSPGLSKGRFEPHPVLDRLSQNLERSSGTVEMNYFTWERFAGRDAEYATSAARRTVQRATESAFKKLVTDLVEEQARIDEVVDAISSQRQPTPAGPRTRYVLGVSRSLPRLDVKRSVGELAMRLSFGAGGQVGIDLSGSRNPRAWFHGGYDVRTRTIDVRYQARF